MFTTLVHRFTLSKNSKIKKYLGMLSEGFSKKRPGHGQVLGWIQASNSEFRGFRDTSPLCVGATATLIICVVIISSARGI